ncbi:MAG: ATP-binding cassette domain-containing protein [Candidatus Dormibacteraeota bacterium]|nr:ATP-binding cassette domain-containing protein [Candidatus Dormibacteraeota bacterium]
MVGGVLFQVIAREGSRLTELKARVEARRSLSVQPSGAVVELTGVSRQYGRLLALDDVSLSIHPGELVFVVGPSEAGKSTMLKIIHGDLRPSKGSVRVHRTVVRRHSMRRRMRRLRRQVGAVFQDMRLLPDMTALENIVFALQVADLWAPRREARARARAGLEMVGLGERARFFPRQLSGGAQRRLAIARALVRQPAILVADEPTANLDRQNADTVLNLLEALARQGTAVVVASPQLPAGGTRGHRVVEIEGGKLTRDTAQEGRES